MHRDTGQVNQTQSRRRARGACTSIPPLLAAALFTASLGAGGVVDRADRGKSAAVVTARDILAINGPTVTSYLPKSATSLNDTNPIAGHAAVYPDGVTKYAALSGAPWAAAPGNDAGWNRSAFLAGLDLYTGTYDFSAVDYSNALLQRAGIVIGRSHIARQKNVDSDHVSNGPMGENWSYGQGEVLLFTGATADKDVLYLSNPGGGVGHIAFTRFDASSVEFQATDGAHAVAKFTAASAGDPGFYSITWGDGTRSDYFDASVEAGVAAGQFWRIYDTEGDASTNITAYAGHPTDGSQAVTDGYTAEGFPKEIMIDADATADDLRISYTYTTGTVGGTKRVDIIYCEIEDGTAGWEAAGQDTIIAKIDHDHYTAEVTDRGLAGDLKLVTVSTLMSDAAYADNHTLYTYDDTTAYNATTNPYPDHYVRMMIESTGYDSLSNPATATVAELKEVSSVHLAYDVDFKVTAMFANGQCGCSGAPDGLYAVTYADKVSPGSGFNDWTTRIQVIAPDYNSNGDNAYTTTYFNKAGQTLATVDSDGDPTVEIVFSIMDFDRDTTTSVIDSVAFRDANKDYTHDSGGNPDGTITRETGAGLVHHYTRKDSATVLEGLMNEFLYSTGDTGTKYLIRTQDYTSRQFDLTEVALTAAFVDERNVYHNTVTPVADAPGDYDQTSRTITFWGTTATARLFIARDKIVTTNPIVTTAQNGSGTATSSTLYLREDGSVAFAQSTEDIYTYTKITDGQVVEQNIDISSSATVASGDATTNWTGISLPSSSVAADRITTMEYDTNSRNTAVVLPDGRRAEIYYLALADGRLAMISVPRVVTGVSTTYYGPASYRVTNLAGGTEFTSTLAIAAAGTTTSPALWADTGDENPFEAADFGPGTVFKAVRNVYTANGSQLDEIHTYFLNKTASPWYGTEPTNFDTSAKYEYSEKGQRWRSITAAGTISRSKFDQFGNLLSSWIGTNDNEAQFPGGDTSGTSDMVKVSEIVYDAAGVGNGRVTKRTAFVDDSPSDDKRVTDYTYNVKGNLLFTEAALAPHRLYKVDAKGRVIASAQYSAIHGSFDPLTADPVGSATYDKLNRVRASEAFYDAMGRVYQSEIHEVIQSTGVLNDSLTSDTWRDKAGRTVCVQGQNFTKHEFDRLGRKTEDHILSDVNDTTYAHRIGGVALDTVLETVQTRFESTDSDNVIMTVNLSRYHDNTGTGKLDVNADNDDLKLTATDIVGKSRAYIIAAWYDDLDRTEDSVVYGTYTLNDSGGNANFNRSGLSVPARSDTALRTTITYNDDGTVKDVKDPMAFITRSEYDDAGRVTKKIENYVDGTPGGGTGDEDDRITKFEFIDGLRTKITADLPGSQTDQDTIYTYGVTMGVSAGDSKIGSKDLPHTVQYPDSSGGSDVVTKAYNAQSQAMYMKDQNGTVDEIDFDVLGRMEHGRITSVGNNIDTAVRRVTLVYASSGVVSSASQYDNATVGSGSVVNSVTYSYDDWLAESKQEQDHNSAAGGTLNYDIDYVSEKATGGRRTLRLDTLTYPDGTIVDYEYGLANSIEDDFSRVDQIKIGATAVVNYEYMGSADVVSWDYLEPDARQRLHGGNGSGTTDPMQDLDLFNRVTSSRWNGYRGATARDIFDADIAHDRISNITRTEDNILIKESNSNGLFDVKYTIDELNRVTRAKRGHWDGSAVTDANATADEQWTLSQWGNWSVHKLDRDGDLNYNGTNELDENNPLTGTPVFFNAGNEWLRRDTDNDSTVDETLEYDAAGNLTKHIKRLYTWDGLGRLVKIEDDNTYPPTTIAEYSYDAVGRMIGMHYDTTRSGGGDPDGTVDSNDPWFRFVYDGQQLIATYRADDALSKPKEHFYSNKAGLSGTGSSSDINDIFKRERDHNTNWYDVSDGTMERGDYILRNWRGDNVLVLTDAGTTVERVKYNAYGMPFGIPAGDTDSDGDYDINDINNIGNGPNTVLGDVENDNDEDIFDILAATVQTLAWDTLSGVGMRTGYAGYQLDPAITAMYHVRARKFSTELGQWLSRDPKGYVDGLNLYQYVRSQPLTAVDPSGLAACRVLVGDGGDECKGLPPVRIWPRTIYQQPPYDWTNCRGFFRCTSIERRPGVGANTNGCGPGGNAGGFVKLILLSQGVIGVFSSCCDNHDFCYGACGANKSFCDFNFLGCMVAACNTKYPGLLNATRRHQCKIKAYAVYLAVLNGGYGPFCAAQRTNCRCKTFLPPPPPTYIIPIAPGRWIIGMS